MRDPFEEAARQACRTHWQKPLRNLRAESEDAAAIRADALRAEAWAGEPFLRADEDPDAVLAPGTARRRALDDALAEIDAGATDALDRVEGALRAPARARARPLGAAAAPRLRHRAAPPPGRRARRHAHRADRGRTRRARTGTATAHGRGAAPRRGRRAGRRARARRADADDELPEPLPSTRTPARSAATASAIRPRPGKTIAASGFVEAARTEGVLILTHRRLLVDQFRRELTEHGYGERFHEAVLDGHTAPRPPNPITIQTYAWFARHVDEIARDAYQLVICDEAHTALGEKTSAAIRSLDEPIYIGMTATEELIAKQVSDVFPASVDDLPLADAARRGLIAPLRCLRVPPVAAINQVPIVGGDFEERALAQALDHEALNMAAATLYRERFGDTPGIVYAAGVDHAYNLATAFRAAGIKAEAVSGRTPPVKLAEILAAYERAEIDVLINAMLLAEGWNSPRATVVMHLAPTASKRVYQQRIGRIMRIHPRKEAGIVVDFTPKAATHNERVVSLHSLLDADFYREGARVTPAPRRRMQRRARRKLTPASWLVPVTPDVLRRKVVIAREWQRVDPKFLDEDEQEFWGEIAGRQLRFDERAAFVEKLTARGASKRAMETVPLDVRRAEPEPPPAADRARRPCLDEGRARRLRRPRHARDAGVRRGRRTALPGCASCCARSPRGSPTRPTRSSRAGRGGSRARCASNSTARRRRSTRTRSGCSARSPTRAATGTRRTRRSSSTPRSRCRARSAPHCSPRPRATRRVRRSCSRRRVSGSGRSRRSPAGSRTTCRSRRPARRARAGAAAARRSRPETAARPDDADRRRRPTAGGEAPAPSSRRGEAARRRRRRPSAQPQAGRR